jgi:Zn-dependent M28 family amino/carboxypeptidase
MKARNVLAWIPGKDTNSFVVCGAHYDHLGKYNGVVWNGADDNASGTVGVMEMAKAFITTGQKPEYSIVFAAWTGEEKGLLGSNYYVDNALKLKQKIQLNFNFDMISRDSPSDTAGLEIGISYMTGRKDLKEMVMNNNEKYQFRLKISLRESDGKRGGSDYVPFGTKGIAFLGHYAGWHDDYHMPGDETSKTNYKKLTQIIRLSFANLWDVSTIVKKQE